MCVRLSVQPIPSRDRSVLFRLSVEPNAVTGQKCYVYVKIWSIRPSRDRNIFGKVWFEEYLCCLLNK